MTCIEFGGKWVRWAVGESALKLPCLANQKLSFVAPPRRSFTQSKVPVAHVQYLVDIHLLENDRGDHAITTQQVDSHHFFLCTLRCQK